MTLMSCMCCNALRDERDQSADDDSMPGQLMIQYAGALQMHADDAERLPEHFFLFRTFPAVSGSGARRQCPEAEFKCGARRRHSGQSLVAGARGSRYWYEIRAGAVPRDVPSAGLAQTRGLPPEACPRRSSVRARKATGGFPDGRERARRQQHPGGTSFC